MHRFALMFFLAATFSSAQVDLGYRLHSAQIPHKNVSECTVAPMQTYACVKGLTIDGVRFDVVAYQPKHETVTYLFTTDPKFSTKSGVHVGDWITVDERDVVLYPGLYVCGPRLPDGWRIIVGYDSDQFEPVKFSDGTTVNLVRTVETPLKQGKVRVIGFEKGGV
jgi:hypothetical protein